MANNKFEDYNRVKKAFKEFIHALLWEANNIDAGAHEREVEAHINGFCTANGEKLIDSIHDSVMDYVISLTPKRYEVHLYEYIEGTSDVNEETAKHFATDDIKEAFAKAAMFYRCKKDPQVNIFDNELGDYIAEWDSFSADY
jgi:hypothetical protein